MADREELALDEVECRHRAGSSGVAGTVAPEAMSVIGMAAKASDV